MRTHIKLEHNIYAEKHILEFTGSELIAGINRLARGLEGLTVELKRANDAEDSELQAQALVQSITQLVTGGPTPDGD